MNTAELMKSSGRRLNVAPLFDGKPRLNILWRSEQFEVPVVHVPVGASKALRRKLCKKARLELARGPTP